MSEFRQVVHDLDKYPVSWSICIGISTLTLAVRLYTRAKILGRISWDDWTMIIAWMLFTAEFAVIMDTIWTVDGLFEGRGLDFRRLSVLIRTDSILYVLCMLFCKLSVGIFFYVFGVDTVKRAIIHTIIIVTLIISVVYCVFSAVSCAGLATLYISENCASIDAYMAVTLLTSTVNCIADVGLATLAMHAVWGMRISRRTRFLTSIILLLGTVAGAASLARGVFVYRAASSKGYNEALNAGVWTALEMGIGITAPSLACLRPLMRKFTAKATTVWRRYGTAGETDPTAVPGTVGTRQVGTVIDSMGAPKPSNFTEMRLAVVHDEDRICGE